MSIRIVVADDAPFIREIVRATVEAAGMEVVAEAVNGLEAVEMVEKFQPDVVLMDMVMPEKNGLEATEEILSRNPKQKVVAFSTVDAKNMMVRALAAGCSDFLLKPFEMDQLLETIRRSCSDEA